MTKYIELTRGKRAAVDDADYDWLNQWKWCAHKSVRTYYAVRSIRSGQSVKSILMHRLIIDAPYGVDVDHRDHDGLNCTRKNLRLCTNTENHRNEITRRDNTSGYKGVSFDKHGKFWVSQIYIHGKKVYLGCFSDKIKAAHAYDAAARRHFGEFANTNF